MFGKKESSVKTWTVFLTFLVGLALGLTGPVFAPGLIDPYMPEMLKGQHEAVEGAIKRKQREQDRLLLTISTPRGAILATFTERVTEIDLLVEEGDRVTLNLRRYSPFVTDPRIAQVNKQDQPRETAAPQPSSSTGPSVQSQPPTQPSEPSAPEPAAPAGPPVSDPSSPANHEPVQP